MHSDAKMHFKLVLGAADAATGAEQWAALQPKLDLHERLEDEFLYTPLQAEMGAGTPLGDWDAIHEADVALVNQLIAASNKVEAGSPEWRMLIGAINDALSKHVMAEEGQIFPRVEQVWGLERLRKAGEAMQATIDRTAGARPPARSKDPVKTASAATAAPTRRRR
jgi:hypothetical protein